MRIEDTTFKGKIFHWSDCATHNEPAYPNGECDCGYSDRKAHEFAELFVGHILPNPPPAHAKNLLTPNKE